MNPSKKEIIEVLEWVTSDLVDVLQSEFSTHSNLYPERDYESIARAKNLLELLKYKSTKIKQESNPLDNSTSGFGAEEWKA